MKQIKEEQAELRKSEMNVLQAQSILIFYNTLILSMDGRKGYQKKLAIWKLD